jgi:hypothetical protein
MPIKKMKKLIYIYIYIYIKERFRWFDLITPVRTSLQKGVPPAEIKNKNK